MKSPASTLGSAALVAGLALAATLLNLWLDRHVSLAGLTLVYLLVVVGAAALLSRWAGALASVVCVSALNFFFIPPRNSFQVDSPEYLLMLVLWLAFSLGINALIAQLQERGALADLRREQAEALRALSEHLSDCKDGSAAMAQGAAVWLQARVGQPCAVFLAGQASADLSLHGQPVSPGNTGPAFHPRSARWAIENRRPLGRGCADWSDLPLWCAPFQGQSPSGAVQVLWPVRQAVPDLATRKHWQALVRQVGLCVERELAAERARAATEASRSEMLRNAVLAGLSHDLRTPLAGIMGSASTLREQRGQLSIAQQDGLLLNLENLARDMTLMAENTLQWTRLADAPPLRLQWESLEELLGEAAARARQRWRNPGIEVRVGKDLPPVMVEARLLMQVLANLLDNAARHGGPTAGRIGLQAGRNRDGVFIAVRDQGQGLPPGDPQALFQRFRQGEAAQADAKGTGLGLSLCQTIVQAHGGSIEARRCEDKAGGAEFYIALPTGRLAPAESEELHDGR